MRKNQTSVTPSAQLVANALDFIKNNVADGITSTDVARHLKVSRSLIELRMREVHGASLAATLRKHRLSLVKNLLQKTDRPVIRILADCGFRNIRAAENLFRKEAGLSPREWRRQKGSSQIGRAHV